MAKPLDVSEVRSIEYFRSLTDAEAAILAKGCHARSYPAREMVMNEGDPPEGFYFLRSGKARIFRTNADGREQTFRIAASGDTFGEVPMLDGDPNPASVETLEPSEVVLVPTQMVFLCLDHYPAVGRALLLHVSRRLRSFTELVEQISLQTVQARLARYLYILAREEGIKNGSSIIVPREITQQDLASLVGSVREVVSRTLKHMEEDGVVTVRRREIEIHDLDALRLMV